MTDAPHSPEFRRRRFLNWFPLGLTYAALYMGRYNFNVVKGDLGRMYGYDKAEIGLIATAGFWTYALAVMINGPFADRIGGRRAILLGVVGAAAMNLLIGTLFGFGWSSGILLGLSVLYSVNMYFQSYGALSVVKVNAAWFRVRERGVFGGIFGVMISSGYFLAISIGGWIASRFPWYWVFLVPSAVMLAMFAWDYAMVRDRPSQTGHPDLQTGDASSGDDTPVDLGYIVRKVLKNPIILTIAAAEFCTGFVRQGVLLYFPEFLLEVHQIEKGTTTFWWAGTGITIGGICGGLIAGWLSDHVFDSRRPPVAVLFYGVQVLALVGLGLSTSAFVASAMVGFTCTWIFGVHGMLSGTASMDFGGKKAAASAAGLLDGIQYVASGLTGFGLGYILDTWGWDGAGAASVDHAPRNALVWVAAIIPFSVAGGLIMLRLWNARPRGASAH